MLEDASRVKAEADIRGTTALVATTGVKNGMHFTIDVPARSDIDIDLSAGDLEIRGIEGSKKVGSWAGRRLDRRGEGGAVPGRSRCPSGPATCPPSRSTSCRGG